VGCITNDISKEALRIKATITRQREQIDEHKAEIDEREGEVAILEDELSSLDAELETLEQEALNGDEPMEIHFDDLVENLCHFYDYVIERDPWVMKERWDIRDAQFCCLMCERNTVYSSTDFYPTKDSLMTLRGNIT